MIQCEVNKKQTNEKRSDMTIVECDASSSISCMASETSQITSKQMSYDETQHKFIASLLNNLCDSMTLSIVGSNTDDGKITTTANKYQNQIIVELYWRTLQSIIGFYRDSIVKEALTSLSKSPTAALLLTGLLEQAAKCWSQNRQDSRVTKVLLEWILGSLLTKQWGIKAVSSMESSLRRSLMLAAKTYGLQF
jgi:hypothetical protein